MSCECLSSTYTYAVLKTISCCVGVNGKNYGTQLGPCKYKLCHFSTQSHTITPIITPANPRIIAPTSPPPLAGAAPLVGLGDAALPVELPVAVALADTAARLSVCPKLGNDALGSTAQPLSVDVGHATAEMAVADAE